VPIFKTKKDIEALKKSGAILAAVLFELKKSIDVGITLSSLDRKARNFLMIHNARPAFLNYKPEWAKKAYPAAICASVNEKIVHGIPNEYKIREGDLVKIDMGVDLNGYITDAAITVGVGVVSKNAKKLIATTEEALYKGIDKCVLNNRIGDIGNAIENHAKKNGATVISGLTGHGVGFNLHEEPTVYNFGARGKGMELKEGLVIAIEPMFSLGSKDIVQTADEGYATADGSLSAHFEHTVAIGANGPEILTKLI
jgi:methionyl aminopeptidase